MRSWFNNILLDIRRSRSRVRILLPRRNNSRGRRDRLSSSRRLHPGDGGQPVAVARIVVGGIASVVGLRSLVVVVLVGMTVGGIVDHFGNNLGSTF